MSRTSTWWALDRKGLETATASDRAFFESHPHATSRERAFVPGEADFPRPPCGYEVRVKVVKLGPAIRTREIYMQRKEHA